MLDGGDQRRVGQAVGQPDSGNRVIESVVRWHLPGDGATFRIDENVVRIDTNLAQHGPHKCGFVLAIAIAMRINIGRRMWLNSPDTQLNRHIADVMLREITDRLHLLQRGGFRRSQCDYLLLYF